MIDDTGFAENEYVIFLLVNICKYLLPNLLAKKNINK